MAVYQLQSGSTVLVAVSSSSNLDGSGKKATRRGSVILTLGDIVVQYLEGPAIVGDQPIQWHIPRADRNQRGVLQSVTDGSFGNVFSLVSPDVGAITVAAAPGPRAYQEKRLEPFFGYEITLEFIRLA